MMIYWHMHNAWDPMNPQGINTVHAGGLSQEFSVPLGVSTAAPPPRPLSLAFSLSDLEAAQATHPSTWPATGGFKSRFKEAGH